MNKQRPVYCEIVVVFSEYPIRHRSRYFRDNREIAAMPWAYYRPMSIGKSLGFSFYSGVDVCSFGKMIQNDLIEYEHIKSRA